MSSVALLLGLLLVAYVGGQLMSGRSGYRLASGAEYLLLGVALGPLALGAVERATLRAWEPVGIVGSAWFALVIGADYGFRDRGRISIRGLLAGLVLSSLTAAAVALAVVYVAPRVTGLRGRELWLVAGGSALVACETTRHAVRWAVGQRGNGGPLSRLVADLADSDDLVPILGVAVLFPALDPPRITAAHVPLWGFALATPAIGIVLGATAAALLRSELRASDGWGVLIGAVLLATGITWRLGLSPQSATFALGVSLSLFSRHGTEFRKMLARSEQAVLLPTLLLAGADLEVHRVLTVLAILALAFAVRVALRVAAGPAIALLAGVKAGSAPAIGAGLLTSGALSITIGLSCASRFPGASGDTILAISVGLAILGELFGPRALRRALVRAGELPEPVPAALESSSSAAAAPAPEALP